MVSLIHQEIANTCLLFLFTQTNLMFASIDWHFFILPDTVVHVCCSEISLGPEGMRQVALKNTHCLAGGLSAYGPFRKKLATTRCAAGSKFWLRIGMRTHHTYTHRVFFHKKKNSEVDFSMHLSFCGILWGITFMDYCLLLLLSQYSGIFKI